MNGESCDSIITLDLSLDPVFITELSDTIMEGESYNVGNSIYTTTGNYIDTLTAINGCDSIVLLNLYVDFTDGLKELSEQLQLNYFPNPFDQTINFELSLPKTIELSIVIVDVHGKEVKHIRAYQALSEGKYNYTVESGQLPQGIYFVHLKTKATQQAYRIVKVSSY